jgi:hypothetical protein
MTPSGKILFHEEQRIRESRIWWFFIAMSVITLGLIVVLGLRGELPKGEFAIALGILLPTYAASFYMMYASKLVVEVSENGVYYRWAPLMRKPLFIPRENITRAEERRSPFMQYGFHLFPGYGKVHNVSGREGIQFYLANGRRIYLGTQELFRFKKALQSILPHQSKA